MQERLQKIISQAGIASRRAAEQLIAAGRVTVDGRAAVLGEKADPAAQRIAVDGKPLPRAERHVYYLLHKPTGYISTARDERGRRTVLDLLPEVRERIYPVGRLDGDTSGLLLITNDGTLMNGLLHPRYEVSKTYVAQVAGQVTEQSLEQLRRGLQLEDGMTAPAKARLLGSRGGLSKVEVTIHEGRNRQVRRMFSAIGCDVRKLKRVRFAFLSLKDVAVGQHRPLTPKEVDRLYQLAGIVRQGDKE
ncbi:MAG: rRNA pseudouridine synthase [Selenomonas sp.]|jgi:23S rRNA pseudouridine2605 synthase|nr:rRNA pseudouridine synthase [Selenomonas sp.]MCI7331512.1 rRNA pseudouridine synthase [Selenomonadaceae bacterium]MDD6120665.1 pseudouridine synthase [Selenomonadaceae bacterium]MDD7056263.1 pseudouridine synthase [Selenomonadaceae bacterium]MDY3915541.1 pseudouridine synthase [Selenomonadaceae bacterium]